MEAMIEVGTAVKGGDGGGYDGFMDLFRHVEQKYDESQIKHVYAQMLPKKLD
jgi:hypothetical protein